MDNFYIVARAVTVEGPAVPVENQLFPINSWFTPIFFAPQDRAPQLQPVKKGELFYTLIYNYIC